MDRAQHVHQHHLPVELREMILKEGPHDAGLVGVIPTLHLAPKAGPARGGGFRQRGEGQHRRPGQIAGQQEPARRHVDPPQITGGGQVGGKALGQSPRLALVQPQRAILGPGQRKIGCRFGAFLKPGEGAFRPLLKGLIKKREVEKPLARVVDDVEMQGMRPPPCGEQPRRQHPERQAKLRDRPGRGRPARAVTGQRGQVRLVVETGQRDVGLRLQVDRLDAALGLRLQLRHPAPVEQVRDEGGDEHGLARPRQSGHAEAEGAVEQGLGQRCPRPFDPAGKSVRQPGKHPRRPFLPAGTKIGRAGRDW